jgi:tRNA (mo5U34)-methyltransferase
MNRQEAQARIDAIKWYHEFDFGDGLVTHSGTGSGDFHRSVWRLIRGQLDTIDFRDKTVLDIGCWDGYWSFYAEGRGARHVLATDDRTQNWSNDSGVHLAKELLHSRVEINQDVSVYELTSLGRKFDIILCLGVYYHLFDPFYAFAQVRHCCHPGTVVVFEGDIYRRDEQEQARYCFNDPSRSAFIPSRGTLNGMLRAAYLHVRQQTWPGQTPQGLRRILHFLRTGQFPRPMTTERAVTVCMPFEGENPVHYYRPPFGLHAYDPRFAGRRQVA